MPSLSTRTSCLISSALVIAMLLLLLPARVAAQNTVTGAFEGVVTNSVTGQPVAGAVVRFVNQVTGIPAARRSDAQGRFYQGLLAPGTYRVEVVAAGYKPHQSIQTVFATRTDAIRPLPILLEPETAAAAPTPTPQPAKGGEAAEPRQPAVDVVTKPVETTAEASTESPSLPPPPPAERAGVEINMTDGRRGDAFTEREVSTLPLGSVTLVRTFDELALLLPGVALPPQTQGNVAGPGVGAGVGSAGQFSVNGLPSRANNFTVDGSDNNDEDIGVRRQGFLSLVPQPIESIQEYQIITLLAPAQFGRNIGAQVNAVSKSGGSDYHGAVYGFLNASNLNAREFFDRVGGDINTPLQGRTSGGQFRPVRVNGTPVISRNAAGAENSLTLSQTGLVFGGPLVREDATNPGRSLFFFVSAEGQLLNSNKEVNFAVPTVEERGLFRSGAEGLSTNAGDPVFPTTLQGDAIFSLFPFPNNPDGVYGRNTYTTVLPADGEGKVASGKVDGNFLIGQRQQSVTARYNFTDDFRDIPVTGGALFSSLRPNVRTQNFSTFLNSQLSSPTSTRPVFNQLRASYGRTRLNFEQRPNVDHLSASNIFPGAPFLLNAPLVINDTLPNETFVDYFRFTSLSTELGFPDPSLALPLCGFGNIPGRIECGALGPVGQVVIAGFSPVGVDVLNFPQRRVNNTYQLADTVTMRLGSHNVAFGTDIRRTELNSDLPRNARPLIAFTGMPQLLFDDLTFDANDNPVFDNARFSGFFEPASLAAAAAASVVSQSLERSPGASTIGLRYYQFNFFGQDEWRVKPNLSLSFGLRYEYNTPAREVNDTIERTFGASDLSLLPGLRNFLEGRSEIYDADRNNFAPRVGLAYATTPFGDRTTVVRAGYGIFYDQILGAVVSQSRNVFPNFLTLNTAGGLASLGSFNIFNPALSLANGFSNGITVGGTFQPFVPRGSGVINQYNSNLPLDVLINVFAREFPGGSFGFTLPARQLEMPTAHHYSFTFEQELTREMVVSAAYVGTQGRHLLRLSTPNLGPNPVLIPAFFSDSNGDSLPEVAGFSFSPGIRLSGDGTQVIGGRPTANAGVINLYETSGNSRYDALQLQVRGRYASKLHFQGQYTFSRAEDDVSDVFDVAGAPALPQNSLTRAGERADSNFDARHRLSYNLVYTLPSFAGHDRIVRAAFGGIELASTGQFQTGQPFTVNSIFDVNLDGNLTDRPNSTAGITRTGDRQRPLRLTGDSTELLAPIGQDGSVPRNSFRASNLLLFNLAVVKRINFTESQALTLRAEVFNLTDRDNFGIPVRFLEAPGFGQATDTVTPGRRIQFALKYSF